MRYYVSPSGRAAPKSMWEEVFLVYWWRGREFADFNSLPASFRSLVRQSKRSDTKYLVYASVDCPVEGGLYGYSRCMGIDVPSRKYGRDKALGWLTKKALDHGLQLFGVEE